MKILSIDMGKFKSVANIWTGPDREKFRTIPTTPSAFHDLFVEVEPDLILIEIGPLAGWVTDLARGLERKIEVANTSDEPWRWNKVKQKTDREDTRKMIRLWRLGELKTVYIPERDMRQWRALIAYREDWMQRVNSAKNRIRAILASEGETMPSGDKAWNDKYRQKTLKTMCRPLAECGKEQLWRGMLELELEALSEAERKVAEVEKKLEEIAQGDERVKLPRTAPVVGLRVAEVVVSAIDRPERFRRGKQLGAYGGFTPRKWQSGKMEIEGHISHAGNELIRKRLVQVAWLGVRLVPWMKELYERLMGGNKKRKRLAIVAVARHLFVRLWAMLRDNKPWDEAKWPPREAEPGARERVAEMLSK